MWVVAAVDGLHVERVLGSIAALLGKPANLLLLLLLLPWII